MSGDDAAENKDEESIWDEIGEFTGSDQRGDEAVADAAETSVEADVIDVQPTEPDASDSQFDELDAEHREPTGSTETTAGETVIDQAAADQPAEAVQEPDTDHAFDELEGHGADAAAPDAEEVFDEMDVSQVDGEALWDELAGSEAGVEADEPPRAGTDSTVGPGDVDEPQTTGGGPEQTTPTTPESEGDETVVDKRQYCQQCPYFSEPPEVSCHHEGTSIVEVLMDGQFRLRGCPVVTDSGPDRTILNDEH